jgi:hypothetical protein
MRLVGRHGTGLHCIGQVTLGMSAANNPGASEPVAWSPALYIFRGRFMISQVSGSPENPGQFNVKRAADRSTDVFPAGSMLLHEGHRK